MIVQLELRWVRNVATVPASGMELNVVLVSLSDSEILNTYAFFSSAFYTVLRGCVIIVPLCDINSTV